MDKSGGTVPSGLLFLDLNLPFAETLHSMDFFVIFNEQIQLIEEPELIETTETAVKQHAVILIMRNHNVLNLSSSIRLFTVLF